MAVMGEAFRRSFPLDHNLPPAMSAVLARLAALDSKPASAAATCGKVRAVESRPTREQQVA